MRSGVDSAFKINDLSAQSSTRVIGDRPMTRHDSSRQEYRHGLRSPRQKIGACVPLIMRRARRAKERAPRLPCLPEVAFLTVLAGLLAKATLLAISALSRPPPPSRTSFEGGEQSPRPVDLKGSPGADETAGIIHGQIPGDYLPTLSIGTWSLPEHSTS